MANVCKGGLLLPRTVSGFSVTADEVRPNCSFGSTVSSEGFSHVNFAEPPPPPPSSSASPCSSSSAAPPYASSSSHDRRRSARRSSLGRRGLGRDLVFRPWLPSHCRYEGECVAESKRAGARFRVMRFRVLASEGHQHHQEQEELPQPYGIPATSVPYRWDVIGLGQAMVDFSAIVDDDFIENLGLVKGTRTVVNHEERGRAIQGLDGCSYKVTAGGSLSNTLVALARLGAGKNGDLPLHIAMTGSVGSDPLGDFYRTKLLRANVHFLSEPIVGGTTGTVIVCTTRDAQRTMLSYQGMSSLLNFDEALEKQISMSRVLVVEGYLWELSETIETIARACKKAKEQGVLVALTASDVSCVNRHRDKMWEVMAGSADILFSNADEARALLGCNSVRPAEAAEALSRHCPFVSVTDGVQGSYIGVKGEVSYLQPASCVPVDTCGAGDAYAAGVLYGLLRGVPDIKGIGNLAARVAAVVVGQQGTRLKLEDARDLATRVPTVSCTVEGLNLSINA